MDKYDYDDSWSDSDDMFFWYDDWYKNEGHIRLRRASTNQWGDDTPYDMPESPNELSYDSHMALPPLKEVIHDVPDPNHQDYQVNEHHHDLNDEIQEEFGIWDCVDELNIPEGVPDPINIKTDIIVNIAIDIKVEVTSNIELKLILNESVKEPIYFLAIAEKVSVEEVDEFDSFSSNKGNRVQVTKTSHDMKRMKLKVVIPRKTIWGWLRFGTKWLVMGMSCRLKIRQYQWNRPKGLVHIH
ncbi:hypothetical protein PVK06_043929 [Gossypium arboreum]|uniref:Uncharacterized protein n=1 Tax=Gossypium arboreum TaxID=29729 RepID=A0ABR0MQ72_GOSAR|nr:hypothetical protein PVK06_043929 [Gossypium arboreum]